MTALKIGQWWRAGPSTYLRCPDCETVLKVDADDIEQTGDDAEVVAVSPEHGKRFYTLAGWPGRHEAHLKRETCPHCRGRSHGPGNGYCHGCNGAGVVFVTVLGGHRAE